MPKYERGVLYLYESPRDSKKLFSMPSNALMCLGIIYKSWIIKKKKKRQKK